MTISNPTLTITFYTSTPETVTVSSCDIIRHSFTFKEQILNGLSPSSNSVSFKLHRDAEVISKILSYQVDARAVLSDGNTTLFTGYLSDNYTWMVNTTGESELEIVIEDVGTKLLGKAFLTSDSPSVYYLAGKVYSGNNSILTQICIRAGISIAANQDLISTEIAANIDKNITCKELLGNILLESGYTYYFNNLGALCLYKIDCTSINNVPVIDKNQLYEVNKNAITLTKRIKQYKQVNVSYDEYETRNNALVYKDISGQDSTHPDCNITIKPNAYYPVQLRDVATVNAMKALGTADVDLNSYVRVTGTNKVYQVVELGTPGAAYDGTTYSFVESSVSEVSFVEAKDLDSGKEIISISNVSGTVNYTGSVSYAISQRGSKNISVVLHNTGNSDANITKLQATATIVDLKAKCIVVAGEAASSNESDNVYSTHASYIHNREYASLYANLISNYYKYCNYTYQFNATVDYDLGSIVNVVDNIFSGLTVNLLLTAKNYSDKSSVIKYTGVAVSPFDLSADTNSEQTLTPVTPASIGPEGPAGESITTTFEYAMTTSSSVTPSTWYETRPSGWQTGYCYWYREKFEDESGNVTYSSPVIDVAYNSMMEGLVIFEVKANPSSFKRNLRTTNDQTITINVKKDYIPGNCTITATTEDSVSIPVTTVIANEKYTITVNDVNDFDKITITGTISGIDPQEVVLNVVDETDYNKNFGSVTALPSETTINGDYFFAETTFGDCQAGFPYVKEGGSWTQLVGTSPDNAQRLIGVMGTVLNDEQTPASLSAIYGWFKNLAAQSAVINSLFSEAITILNNGYIKSANFSEVDGFVSQGFKLNASGLGQFGEGTQLGNVDIRINDTVSGTPVQLLTTSKYAEGATYSIPAKSRWNTSDFFTNANRWGYCQSPYTDTPNITYNGSNYYRVRTGSYDSSIEFKPGETSDYVLKFDKACTVTLKFNGRVGGIGRYLANLIIDGNNYSFYIRDFDDSRTTVTYTKTVAAGGTITVNTRNFPYKPNNTGTENDGVRLLGSTNMTISGSSAVICNKRVMGYSSSSSQTLPTAGTFNFTVFPQNTFIQNSFSFTHTYSGGGTVYSSDFINYTNVSPLASIQEGNYTCINSSVGGYTITALSRSGSTIYLYTSDGNTLEYILTPDTSTFATSGWYNTSGSITLVGSQSSLITYNINASNSSADIGAVQPYNNIHANNFYGTHRGYVNGNASSAYSGGYKVWGAVFN